jgi:SPX domain protein involved in polyphosphate accumulation
MPAESPTIFERHERKFPLRSELWTRAAERAAGILPVERFDGAHGRTTIRTVYLDTPALDSYREYVLESPLRRKVRIRQYVNGRNTNGECWLEIKIKHYTYSLKRRVRSHMDQIEALLEGHDIAAHVAEMNGGHAAALGIYRAIREAVHERNLRPVLQVVYDRTAFQQPGGRQVRLTLYRHIRFHAAGREVVKFPGIVLEAKFPDEEPSWLHDLMQDLSLSDWSRFSKYARAVRDLGLAGRR